LSVLVSQARQTWNLLEDNLLALSEAALTEPHNFAWADDESLGPKVLREVSAHFHQDHEVPVQYWLAGFRHPVDEGL
jgi:hypothetical protein